MFISTHWVVGFVISEYGAGRAEVTSRSVVAALRRLKIGHQKLFEAKLFAVSEWRGFKAMVDATEAHGRGLPLPAPGVHCFACRRPVGTARILASGRWEHAVAAAVLDSAAAPRIAPPAAAAAAGASMP